MEPTVNTTIPKDPQKIQSMFSKVASGYDLANTVLSMGIHHLWRHQLVGWAELKPSEKILDCATGTGDLALKMKATSPTSEVIGTDFCEPMLAVARQKDLKGKVHFQWADATQLPFPTESFDLVTISFGIRNVQNPEKAIQEMHRVLRPGGRLMVLEFGQPKVKVFDQLYRFYSNNILPQIGGLVTGEKSAYQYLQESSSEFPCREQFCDLVQGSATWSSVNYRSLTGGIAYLYKATKA